MTFKPGDRVIRISGEFCEMVVGSIGTVAKQVKDTVYIHGFPGRHDVRNLKQIHKNDDIPSQATIGTTPSITPEEISIALKAIDSYNKQHMVGIRFELCEFVYRSYYCQQEHNKPNVYKASYLNIDGVCCTSFSHVKTMLKHWKIQL